MKTTIAMALIASLMMACGGSGTAPNPPKGTEVASNTNDPLKTEAMSKVKAVLQRDYPNDFITQKMLLDGHSDAYDYLATVPKNVVLDELRKQYPNDFITQKMLYIGQVEAAESLKEK